MSLRTVSLEYRDAHYKMIRSLERGVKRPKVQAGNRMSSHAVSTQYDQPRGIRRSSF